MKVKVVAHKDEGERIDGEYDVQIDGEVVGRVRRYDGTPNGYWGRWSGWAPNHRKFYTDSRRDAVDYVVRCVTEVLL